MISFSVLNLSNFFLFVLCLIFLGCQSSHTSSSDIDIHWKIDPDPPVTGTANIQISMTDSTGQQIQGADINLEGNMTHPGMQPVFTTAEEVESGLYSAKLNLKMGGDWYILITSTLPDNRTVRETINLPGVRAQ